MTDRVADPRGVAARNRPLVRFALAHLVSVIAEWASFIGALVYAYDRSGEAATGVASVAILVPYIVISPLGVSISERRHPVTVRAGFFAMEAMCFAGAAIGAFLDGPTWVVVGSCSLALAAIAIIRPTSAVILPSLARSSSDLTTANLWFGWCEGFSVLVGPLFATGMLAMGGSAAVLAGCTAFACTSAAMAAVSHQSERAAVARPAVVPRESVVAMTIRSLHRLRRCEGATAVLLVAGGQFLLVGAVDLLFVVMAGDRLGLGETGPGLLSAVFGVGAAASVFVSTLCIGKLRLAILVRLALTTIAVGCFALGATTELALVVLVLPWLGLSRSLLDVSTRMLLQRSAPPSELGGVFAVLEMLTGVGMLVGSLGVQAILLQSDAGVAFALIGGCFLVILALSWRGTKAAEMSADVPVEVIALLQGVDVFHPLPPDALEMIAREAQDVAVDAGSTVIRQGERGDRYYVVAEGEFDVVMNGEFIRAASRGATFGEVALLHDVARTATVSCRVPGRLVAIDRGPFLAVVSGSEASRMAAWRSVTAMGALPGVPRD